MTGGHCFTSREWSLVCDWVASLLYTEREWSVASTQGNYLTVVITLRHLRSHQGGPRISVTMTWYSKTHLISANQTLGCQIFILTRYKINLSLWLWLICIIACCNIICIPLCRIHHIFTNNITEDCFFKGNQIFCHRNKAFFKGAAPVNG